MKGFWRGKKKKAAFFFGLSLLTSAGFFAFPSLAWFAKAQTNAALSGIGGKGSGSYFNGGDGSKESPFQIDNARQLYYFNWLQDLGVFNEPNDDSTGIDQTYFVLTSDIDANGYSLPPAGTEEYPFVGNFNGDGHKISNVKITNELSSLTNVPARAKEDDSESGILKQAQIVGFFGVVGSTGETSEVNGYSYDSSANEIKNLGFDSLSVVSASSTTLAGLAAGYVNGTLSGVGVNSSSIATKENASPISDIAGIKNISEYSLVGYATEEYMAKTRVSDETLSMPQIDNPNTSHGSTNWGGSVNMKQMYADLVSERDDTENISKDVYCITSQYVDVDPEGNQSAPYNKTTSTASSDRPYREDSYYKDKYYFRNGERKDEDGNVLASYGFTYVDTSSDGYIYIYGKPGTTPTYSGSTLTTYYNNYAYMPCIEKSGHFLSLSDDLQITDATGSVSAQGWLVPSSGTSGNISTTIGETTYYLICSSGALSVSTSASTSWTYDSGSGNIYTQQSTDSNTYYFLDYDGGWTTKEAEVTSYLVIKDTSQAVYVGYSSAESAPISSSSYNNTTFAWQYDSSNNCYRPISNTSAYLGIKRTGSNRGGSSSTTPIITTQTPSSGSSGGGSNSTTYARLNPSSVNSDGTSNGTYLSGKPSSRTYYLTYSSNSFSATSSTSSRHTFSIEKIIEGGQETGLTLGQSEMQYIASTTTSTSSAPYEVNQTYIPLTYSYENEDTKETITGVSQMNTGYLVGGANYVNGTDYCGDIRIAGSYYTLDKLSYAFGSSSAPSRQSGSSSSTSYKSSSMQICTRTATKNEDGTYTDQGWRRIKDNYNSANIDSYSSQYSSSFSNYIESSSFARYDNARRNLQYTIWNDYDDVSASSSTVLYGMHFMNASISTSHLSQVGKAIVYDKAAEAKYQEDLDQYIQKKTDVKPTQQGSVYYNYDVPEDSIDFNLATKGYINFFGATYYVNSKSSMTNSSFFSLNEIDRDENQKITQIRKINKIYANLGEDKEETPYLYVYDDDDGIPANSDSSHLVFDVSWISTDVTMVYYSVYYFEIPVNPGEYALGSVEDKPGAYLLYLDIGTGAADYDSVNIEEKTISSVLKQHYPKGVDFTSSFSDLPSINGGSSACVAILVAPAKKIDYSYEGSTLTAGASSGVEVVFAKDGVSVVDSAQTALPKTTDTPLLITMERTTVQTYSPTDTTLKMAYSSTWTISGAQKGDEIQLYFLDDAATWASSDESKATVSSSGLVTIVGEGEFEITAVGSGSKTASEDWTGPESIIREDTFSEFKMSLDNGEANVEYVYDEDSKTYQVTVHCTGETNVTILAVPSDSNYKITINGNEVTGVGQTITLPATA